MGSARIAPDEIGQTVERRLPNLSPPVVGDKGDGIRMFVGVCSFLASFLLLIWTIKIAHDSLDAEFKALMKVPAVVQGNSPLTLHFVARVALVAVMAGIAYWLYRGGERLTMPLTRFIETLQWARRGQTKDDARNAASELVRYAVELVKNESKPPKD